MIAKIAEHIQVIQTVSKVQIDSEIAEDRGTFPDSLNWISAEAKLYWKLSIPRYSVRNIKNLRRTQCRQYHFLRFNMRLLNRCPSLMYVAWIRNFASRGTWHSWRHRAYDSVSRKHCKIKWKYYYACNLKKRGGKSYSSMDRREWNMQLFLSEKLLSSCSRLHIFVSCSSPVSRNYCGEHDLTGLGRDNTGSLTLRGRGPYKYETS